MTLYLFSSSGDYIDQINDLNGNSIVNNTKKLTKGEYIIVLLRNDKKIASKLLNFE